MKPYTWIPGQGPDLEALRRMQRHFPMPSQPMGEAWFMGSERQLYHNLLRDSAALDASEIFEAVEVTVSGTTCFGRLDEWREWYHYLLPRVLDRSLERFSGQYLVEILMTGFVTQYPRGVQKEPYAGFREDALLTLGRCLMHESCWDGGVIRIGRMFYQPGGLPNGQWGWWDASGDFSASMTFCLKYLPVEQVEGWLRSVFRITDPHWRAQLVVWYLGMQDYCLQSERSLPGSWPNPGCPNIAWAGCDYINDYLYENNKDAIAENDAFIPAANRQALQATVTALLDEKTFMEWLQSFSAVPYLEAELGDLPYQFWSQQRRDGRTV